MLNNKTVWFVRLVVFLGVGLVLWTANLGWRANQLYQIYQQLKVTFEQARQGQVQLDQAGQEIQAAREQLAALRAGLSPLLPLMRAVGGAAGQVEPLLEYASHTLASGDHLLAAVQPVWQVLHQPGGEDRLSRAVQALNAKQTELDAALFALDQAAASRQRINFDQLPPALFSEIKTYDGLFPQARAAVAILASLPELAGAEGPKDYLVVAQNSDELRATGGFITAAGVARLDQGKLVQFNLSDSYMIDNPAASYPQPPEPFRRYMNAGVWLLRDANWSPDFPTAARQMESLFELSVGQPVDGVIVFDQAALVQVLKIVGPVQVPGFDQPVDASNVLGWMRQAWAPDPGESMDMAWWARRKEFIQDLGQVVIQQILTLRDSQQILALGRALLSSSRQGHILFYVHSPQAQAALRSLSLDGGVHPGAADFLFLVDSNIGFNKIDAVIRRSLIYRVDLSQPDSASVSLEVTYTNPVKQEVPCTHKADYGDSYGAMMQRCYWNYWRVLAAPGSQLLQARARPVPAANILSRAGWDGTVAQSAAEAGTVEFSGLVLLPTNTQESWRLDWSLPAGVVRQQGEAVVYRLVVQKQPGVSFITAQIEVVPPAGKTLAQPPGGWRLADETWVWQGKVTQTTTFLLEFR